MMKRIDEMVSHLDGLKLLERHPISDDRGFLERLYCANELQHLLAGKTIVQINHTLTKRMGTVRGMHFQYPPHAEMKFVSCLRGRVFDVAVDIRRGSPTFLRWHGAELSDDNFRTMAIPEGFAHGFQTLSDDCELLYLHTAAFKAGAEGAMHPQDPKLAIAWPLPVAAMSSRDAGHPLLRDDFDGVEP